MTTKYVQTFSTTLPFTPTRDQSFGISTLSLILVYVLNTESGGLQGYGWLTKFRQVPLSFLCLDNLGKINKSLQLSLWKLPFGRMVMFLLGKQWRFMSGGRVQPFKRSLPGGAFLSWNELNKTSSSTLFVCVTLLSVLRPLFQPFLFGKVVNWRYFLHSSPSVRSVVRRQWPTHLQPVIWFPGPPSTLFCPSSVCLSSPRLPFHPGVALIQVKIEGVF